MEKKAWYRGNGLHLYLDAWGWYSQSYNDEL
jgi:hypothetical protein